MRRRRRTWTTAVAVTASLATVLPATWARAAGPAHLDGAIVDLSYAYDDTTIFWPTEEGFKLEREHGEVTDKGYYYAANKFCTPEHGGTHIDAPLHFNATGKSVDALPLLRMGSSAEWRPSRRTRFVWGLNPSWTKATSPTDSRDPFR